MGCGVDLIAQTNATNNWFTLFFPTSYNIHAPRVVYMCVFEQEIKRVLLITHAIFFLLYYLGKSIEFDQY